MDDDVDLVGGKAEQPVRLDHLEALVHQRRGVDGDLAAHLPGRVLERLRRRRRARSSSMRGAQERAARGGEDDAPHVAAPMAVHRLVDGVVLAVDREDVDAAPRAPRPAPARRRRPALPCWPAPRRLPGLDRAPASAAVRWRRPAPRSPGRRPGRSRPGRCRRSGEDLAAVVGHQRRAAPRRRPRRRWRPARGRKRRTCSASRSTLRPAARAAAAKRSGNRATRSSVVTPMDPVEPSTPSGFTAMAADPTTKLPSGLWRLRGSDARRRIHDSRYALGAIARAARRDVAERSRGSRRAASAGLVERHLAVEHDLQRWSGSSCTRPGCCRLERDHDGFARQAELSRMAKTRSISLQRDDRASAPCRAPRDGETPRGYYVHASPVLTRNVATSSPAAPWRRAGSARRRRPAARRSPDRAGCRTLARSRGGSSMTLLAQQAQAPGRVADHGVADDQQAALGPVEGDFARRLARHADHA